VTDGAEAVEIDGPSFASGLDIERVELAAGRDVGEAGGVERGLIDREGRVIDEALLVFVPQLASGRRAPRT
jgi:hypothetical protein